MPSFSATTDVKAPPEDVWKVLYDPVRFPDWWPGIATVNPGDDCGGPGDVTIYPDGYPDFPMPQQVETAADAHGVVISCLVSDLRFEWRLEERGGGGTRVTVDVAIPEAEAHRVDTQRRVIEGAVENLAALAEAGAGF